jgi:zinc transporter ZupT
VYGLPVEVKVVLDEIVEGSAVALDTSTGTSVTRIAMTATPSGLITPLGP